MWLDDGGCQGCITSSLFTSIHSESPFSSIFRVSSVAVFGTVRSVFLMRYFSFNLLPLADDSLLAVVSLDPVVTGFTVDRISSKLLGSSF